MPQFPLNQVVWRQPGRHQSKEEKVDNLAVEVSVGFVQYPPSSGVTITLISATRAVVMDLESNKKYCSKVITRTFLWA